MNTPHIATDLTELLRALYDDATVERFLTTTGSEGINVEFAPGHAFNITVTRMRTKKTNGRPWQPLSKRHMSS